MPVIQKMSSLSKEGSWINEKKLLAEVEMGPDYQFHSIFTCPVSKDNASDKNPPVLLKCGHAICQQSMLKLIKPPFRRFDRSLFPSFRLFFPLHFVNLTQKKQLHFCADLSALIARQSNKIQTLVSLPFDHAHFLSFFFPFLLLLLPCTPLKTNAQ